jgi:predicted Zn-dependent peptidase
MELWFSLESDRFKNPVFREFYKEKEVVREERRMRTESQPVGRLIEEFLAVAYTAHPYGRPVVGWNSDITATTMEDAREFYNKYYVPSNITIAIAGDVKPDEVKKMAETYFGGLKAGPEPPPVYTKEPEQRGERRFNIQGESQPFLLMGYHTVPEGHPDFKALQLVGSIISSGRTSRLYKRMVEEEELALAVQAFNGFPGTKFESMFLTFAVPNQGLGVDTLETVILEEIQKVKDGDITQEELDRARTNARASLVRSLDSNSGLAQSLASADAQKGDWRTVFTDLEALNEVTLEDLQRVAKKYMTKDNLTVGAIVTKDSEEVADAAQ